MSLRLQAKSHLLLRLTLSHRLLFITLVVLLVLGGVGISNSAAVKKVISVLARNSEVAAPRKTTAGAITVHAADRGKPFLNLQDGRSMQAAYKGESALVNALQ